MSRRTLTSKNPIASAAAAGWDGPLNTFFFQELVTRTIGGSEEEHVNLWIGVTQDEHKDVDAFLAAIAEHAELPSGFRDQLLSDRDAEPHDSNRPAYSLGLLTRST